MPVPPNDRIWSEPDTGQRVRSYGWTPLDELGAPLADRSGLSLFEALRDGDIPRPPVACTIGWFVDEVEAGRVCLSLPVAEYLMHGARIVHGGVLATLLDSAMAGAMITTLARGQGCTTLQLNVNFLRVASGAGGRLSCEGKVIQAGRRTGMTEAVLTDATGRVCARATSTYLVFVSP